MPPATSTSSSNLLPYDHPQCLSFSPSVADHPRRRYRELSLERSSCNSGDPQICLRQSSSHHIMSQMPQTIPFLPRTGSFLHPQATLSRRHLNAGYPNSDAPIMEMSLPPSDCRKRYSALECSVGQWKQLEEEVRPAHGPESTRVWMHTEPFSGSHHEMYPTDNARQQQRLSEGQRKFREYSSFPHLLPPSGPSLESSRLPIPRPSTPMPTEQSEESFEVFTFSSSYSSQESVLSYSSPPSMGSTTEMSSSIGLKSSLSSSSQKKNPARIKKNVRFREPLETFFPAPDDSEEEMDDASQGKDSLMVSIYHPDVEFMNNQCRVENGLQSFVQEEQMSLTTRARAGMDCPKGCGSSSCNPCERSICGSPWAGDVVEVQMASCGPCMPPCPPPCCQMRYYPCPVFGDGLQQQDHNFHRKFRTVEKCPVEAVQFIKSENQDKRHHSGCKDNMACGIDPCACTGPFDTEEAMHHKYRGVSKDQCGQMEVSEKECRQRTQYGDCSPNCGYPCPALCGSCGPC